MKHLFATAAASAALACTPATAATIVNLQGVANASLDGSNAVSVALAAGTYKVTFTQDQFTAFDRFGYSSGCDTNGENCVFGYENSARIIVGGTTYLLGDGDASGGYGPLGTGNGYYATAAQSFGNAGGYSALISLAAPGTARFFIYDDYLSDNVGGISLNVAAVPEPATWAMMIAGFGVVGAAMRRRAKVNPAVSYA